MQTQQLHGGIASQNRLQCTRTIFLLFKQTNKKKRAARHPKENECPRHASASMVRPPSRAPALRVYVRRGTRRGRASPGFALLGRRDEGEANQPTNRAASCCLVLLMDTRKEPVGLGVEMEIGMERSSLHRHLSSFLSCKERPLWVHLVFTPDAPVCCFSHTPITPGLHRFVGGGITILYLNILIFTCVISTIIKLIEMYF
jgi:hypothetical protein